MKLKFNQLNKRQESVLDIIDKQRNISVSELLLFLIKKFSKVSKITVIRDLNKLLKINFIKRVGKGRGVFYQLSNQYNLLKPFDINNYFKIGPDQREVKKKFDFNLLDILKDIFTTDEKKRFDQLVLEYRRNV
ncbi:hypothetical protein KKG58_00995, partial [Patescibacteria group bacterium]|nr:hypothetical protein [Patescibacteria group bacterium]